MDLISKKDLLDVTGISYGQLYRWKRENLIPEAWFIKKASYTGQETFFPKDQILDRVKTILELKDTYTLEELSKMLSPENGGHFTAQEVSSIEEIDPAVAQQIVEIWGPSFAPNSSCVRPNTFLYFAIFLPILITLTSFFTTSKLYHDEIMD